MRLAIVVAAFGLALGAPMFAPTNLMPQAEAQAANDALQAEILAAAGNDAALAAIVAREQAAGNSAGLASALANAATSLAATDISAAATLVIQAVNIAQGVGDTNIVNAVGVAASTVATTAMDRGDAMLASNITTQVAIGRSTDMAMAFVNAGGSAGRVVPRGNTGGDTGGGQQQGGDDDGNQQQGGQQQTGNTNTPVIQQPVVRRTAPPRPIEPTVPIVPEPNPSQAGSPT